MRTILLLPIVATGCENARLVAGWSITLDGAPATCAEVGAEDVELYAVGVDDYYAEAPGSSWPCDAGHGSVRDVTHGPWELELALLGYGLAAGATDREHVEIDRHGITRVDFAFALTSSTTPPTDTGEPTPGDTADTGTPDTGTPPPTGATLELYVDFGAEGGPNCAAAPGVDSLVEERLYLVGEGSTGCVDLPVEGTTGDTCGTPIDCLQPDQVQRIALPAAGAWTLTVEGYIEASPSPLNCYGASFPVDVVGTTELVAVVPQRPYPECADGLP